MLYRVFSVRLKGGTLEAKNPGMEDTMDLGLTERVAVVTGGSMGIGKAIAASLVAEGARVVLIARGKEALDDTVTELSASGGDVIAVTADITDAASVNEAAVQVAERLGTVNIVVNNAGHRMRRMDRQIYWDDQDWLGDIDVKTVGMLRTIRAFLPHIATDGTGRIINISGVAGEIVFHGALTHGINNAAMQMITKYLAKDLAAEKITVNAVSPGLIATEWRHGWAQMMGDNQGKSKDEFLEGYYKQLGIFSERWAEPAEIGDLVAYLASDRASYINGTVIDIDGGITANAR